MTRTGTNHFESKAAAVRYYQAQEGSEAAALNAVTVKLARGEIKLGKPRLKAGQRLILNREEGRYIIEQ